MTTKYQVKPFICPVCDAPLKIEAILYYNEDTKNYDLSEYGEYAWCECCSDEFFINDVEGGNEIEEIGDTTKYARKCDISGEFIETE